MVAIVVLSVAVWLSIPLVLSRAMARRGFDGLSYLIVGTLFGPVAVIFAVMDVVLDAPEPPRILEKGRTGSGDVSVLVVVGGETATSPSMAALTNSWSSLRRVGLVRVLPKGGARLDEQLAERDMRQAAMSFEDPELALVFGRPDVAIAQHAIAHGYDVVVTARPDPQLRARLQTSGRVHWSASDGVSMPTTEWTIPARSRPGTAPCSSPAVASTRLSRPV